MPFDVSKARKDKDPDEEVSDADLVRALEPLREHLREITRSTGIGAHVARLMEQQRQQNREIAARLGMQVKRSMATAYNAQTFGVARQVREALAVYDSRVAEMSRHILKDVNAQMASVRIPRPTLDSVVAEVPYRPQRTPAPVGEVEAAPHHQPSVPAGEQDPIEQFGIEVAKAVLTTLVVTAILWYIKTGVWIFDELLTYLTQHLD